MCVYMRVYKSASRRLVYVSRTRKRDVILPISGLSTEYGRVILFSQHKTHTTIYNTKMTSHTTTTQNTCRTGVTVLKHPIVVEVHIAAVCGFMAFRYYRMFEGYNPRTSCGR